MKAFFEDSNLVSKLGGSFLDDKRLTGQTPETRTPLVRQFQSKAENVLHRPSFFV